MTPCSQHGNIKSKPLNSFLLLIRTLPKTAWYILWTICGTCAGTGTLYITTKVMSCIRGKEDGIIGSHVLSLVTLAGIIGETLRSLTNAGQLYPMFVRSYTHARTKCPVLSSASEGTSHESNLRLNLPAFAFAVMRHTSTQAPARSASP